MRVYLQVQSHRWNVFELKLQKKTKGGPRHGDGRRFREAVVATVAFPASQVRLEKVKRDGASEEAAAAAAAAAMTSYCFHSLKATFSSSPG